MATFLMTWIPDRWPWDDLESQVEMLLNGEEVSKPWSTGRRKTLPAGSRLFLIRLGQEPKGIIGSGWATGEVYADAHWSGEEGRTATYVPMRFDRLCSVEEVLSVELLDELVPEMSSWYPQGSGIEIPDAAARKLETLWAQHNDIGSIPVDTSYRAEEGARYARLASHLRRDRKLRRKKIDAHAAANDGRLPCEVPGCGFDFFATYGALGDGYAQVHHVVPLSQNRAPVTVTLEDLRVLCANCHAIVHREGGSLSLGEVAQALKNAT